MAKFEKGVSGNPAGKKPGTVSKRTKLAILLDPHAESLVNKTVELALEGDVQALRLCMERLIPKAKEEQVSMTFPDFSGFKRVDIVKMLLQKLSGQEVTLEQLKPLLEALKYFGDEIDDSLEKEMIEQANATLDKLREKYKSDF